MSYLNSLKEQNLAPEWMDEESLALVLKYCAEDEKSPLDLYTRLARTAATYLGEEFFLPLLDCLQKGWFSPATPVATNFGAMYTDKDGKLKPRGMPVSCFGAQPANSVDNIFTVAHELAMLSKNGGGLGVDLSKLVGDSCVTSWAKVYDITAQVVSQGGIRRGAIALYLNIEHPNIEAFLHSKDILEGDMRRKLDCNIAVIIPDSFMNKLRSKDKKAAELFSSILKLRMKYGSPYIYFIDNSRRGKGVDYEALNLDVPTSQLCAEITLNCDQDHTFVCILSSLVATRYLEYKDVKFSINGDIWTVPMLAIAFLDAVTESFITLSENIPGFDKARRFAIKSRALGLGVLGWHSLLQQCNYAFDSEEAYALNKEYFSYINKEAKKASQLLAKKFGVPEWCQASKQRNTHLIAIAPTLGNSVLAAAGSPGIDPICSNCYTYAGANGNYVRQNPNLHSDLAYLGLDTPEVWQKITEHNGSIQWMETELLEKCSTNTSLHSINLGFSESIPDPHKLVRKLLDLYKTAYEIDQYAVLKQAEERQPYICQAQSLNLYIPHDTPAQTIADLHIQAWKKGLKTLYYVRSTSPRTKAITLEQDTVVQRWHLVTKHGCSYCSAAKSLLRQLGQDFTEVDATSVSVESKEKVTYPRIYLNDKYIGGYDDLLTHFNITSVDDLLLTETTTEKLNEYPEIVCTGCDG